MSTSYVKVYGRGAGLAHAWGRLTDQWGVLSMALTSCSVPHWGMPCGRVPECVEAGRLERGKQKAGEYRTSSQG